MQSETTTAITAVKQDVRLREWSAQLDAQQSSGMTVPEWCAANGIKTKSLWNNLQTNFPRRQKNGDVKKKTQKNF